MSTSAYRETKNRLSIGYGLENSSAEPAELDRQRYHAAEQSDTCPQVPLAIGCMIPAIGVHLGLAPMS